jgi:hypothetical protein
MTPLPSRPTASLSVALAALLLGACATTDGPTAPAPPTDDYTANQQAPAQRDRRLEQALTTPLSDLNIIRADIPPVLAAASKAPYAAPADRSCIALAADVKALDAVLGADLDTLQTAANPSLVDRAGVAIEGAAVGTVRGAAEGVVPFRSWVRKLTGAERYSREVAAAIAAGTIRRAYLKGLGQAGGCDAPAAPRV